jgi:chromosome segregation ATPase
MVVDSKPDQQLLERVREAEAKKCQLKAENDDLRNDQEKQSLRMEELQVKLDAATASFNQVKRRWSSHRTYGTNSMCITPWKGKMLLSFKSVSRH